MQLAKPDPIVATFMQLAKPDPIVATIVAIVAQGNEVQLVFLP